MASKLYEAAKNKVLETYVAPTGLVTIFFFFDDNTFVQGSSACHISMNGYSWCLNKQHHKVKVIANTFRSVDSVEAQAYLEFLFDKKESPYRKYLTRFRPVRRNGKIVGSLLTVLKNTSAEISTNFMVACRTTYEYSVTPINWYRLVQSGKWSKLEAFVIAARYGCLIDRVRSHDYLPSDGHRALHITQVDYDRLEKGNPKCGGSYIDKGVGYKYISRCWSKTDAGHRLANHFTRPFTKEEMIEREKINKAAVEAVANSTLYRLSSATVLCPPPWDSSHLIEKEQKVLHPIDNYEEYRVQFNATYGIK